jgi:hypothetical protein
MTVSCHEETHALQQETNVSFIRSPRWRAAEMLLGLSAGFSALENPSDLPGDQAIRIRQTYSVADQSAGSGELANIVHRGQYMARRECDQLLAPT